MSEIVKKLIHVAAVLNRERDRLRREASRIAGCDLSDWSFSDIMRYVDLGYKHKK